MRGFLEYLGALLFFVAVSAMFAVGCAYEERVVTEPASVQEARAAVQQLEWETEMARRAEEAR